MSTPRVEVVRPERPDSRALMRAHQHLLLWLRRQLAQVAKVEPPGSTPAG